MAESETVFDVDATFHSARDIQEFMETFCIDNGFKIHKHQYRNKEKEYYRGNKTQLHPINKVKLLRVFLFQINPHI